MADELVLKLDNEVKFMVDSMSVISTVEPLILKTKSVCLPTIHCVLKKETKMIFGNTIKLGQF